MQQPALQRARRPAADRAAGMERRRARHAPRRPAFRQIRTTTAPAMARTSQPGGIPSVALDRRPDQRQGQGAGDEQQRRRFGERGEDEGAVADGRGVCPGPAGRSGGSSCPEGIWRSGSARTGRDGAKGRPRPVRGRADGARPRPGENRRGRRPACPCRRRARARPRARPPGSRGCSATAGARGSRAPARRRASPVQRLRGFFSSRGLFSPCRSLHSRLSPSLLALSPSPLSCTLGLDPRVHVSSRRAVADACRGLPGQARQ